MFRSDAHRFGEGRKLVLGGVEIAHERGLEGHSDADVLTHAIADALLGAISERDIGHHFPNSDDAIRGKKVDAKMRSGAGAPGAISFEGHRRQTIVGLNRA